MKREIIHIDEELCNGCGVCIPNCHEGALQLIDGKARLISDLMCDGLGACIGHCPEGAITMEEREAEPYNETLVMQDMIKKGKNTVIAHLKHLKDHKEFGYMKEGLRFLKEHKNELAFALEEVINEVHKEEAVVESCASNHGHHHGGGCPGSASKSFAGAGETEEPGLASTVSRLTHWPVQMHLINPVASHFQKADLLMAADCVAFSLGNFHEAYLKDKTLAIACPKLDSNKEIYVEKLISLIEDAKINTITVMVMEVPCCNGLLQLVQMATQRAQRKVPVKSITVSIQGKILSEDWI